MIKCVTFDLDDTLWAVRPVMAEANRLLWQWLEDNTPEFTNTFSATDLIEGSPFRREVIDAEPGIAHSMTLVRQRLLAAGLRRVGYSEKEAEARMNAAYQVFIEARHAVTPFTGAADMLVALRDQGYKLGALSNGNADVELTDLSGYFDFQFNADSVGSAKPAPEMFEAALAKTELAPDEVVHVGDHPINDVEGARRVGMRTLWVDLTASSPDAIVWPESVPAADVVVTDVRAIPDAIRELD